MASAFRDDAPLAYLQLTETKLYLPTQVGINASCEGSDYYVR